MHILNKYSTYCSLTFLRCSIIAALLTVTIHASQDSTLLWEMKGTNNTVYLLGSIHAADSSFYPLPNQIISAWDNSPVLCVEVDITTINPQEMAAIVLQYARYPSGKTLESELPKKDFKTLKRYTNDSLGIDINSLLTFKPWYVAQIITMGILHKNGFDESQGIDRFFLTNKGIRQVLELETLEQQIRIFDEVGSDSSFITYALATADSTYTMIHDLMNSWKSGDLNKLEALLFLEKETPQYQHFFKRLFYDRNIAMLHNIKKLATLQQNVFVVVGAGHLITKDGIIEQLRQQGYSVTRK